MPSPTATVAAERYVYGGGREGNVPATANMYFLNHERELDEGVALGDVSVAAVSDGSGGRDPETLEEAFRRTRRDMRTPYRGVTRDDYEYVATHTPGLRFGRATVLVEEAADVAADDPVEVRVVVVPYAPVSTSRPEPSDGFLDAVDRHVERHRLLTDRVTVEPPDYVDLSVDAELRTTGWVPESRVRRAVESSINGYVHAIHGYEDDGWPFGRTLYSAELRDLLESIDFVDHVGDVSVRARGDARVDGEGNVLIDEATLFALDEVRTDVRAGTAYGDGG